MSINLLDLLSSDVGSKILGPASKFLGESEGATNSALAGLLPSILGGLMDKGKDQSGAGDIMDMFSKADPGLLNNMSDIFSGSSNTGGLSSLLGNGSSILGLLFGNNKLGSLIDLVTGHSGMKKSSSSTLIKLIAPFIMSAIGGKVKSMGLDALGLSKLLGDQKGFIKDALPSGFGDALGIAGLGGGDLIDKAMDAVDGTVGKTVDVAKDVAGAAGSVAGAAGNAAKEVGGMAVDTGKKGASALFKWLLPALLALLVIGWFGRQGCNTGVDAIDNAAETVTNTTESVTKGAVDAVGDATGAVADVAGDAVKGAFSAVNDVAKAALDNVEFMTGSIGDQMMKFIDGGLSGDSKFTFTNLTFNSGSAVISGESAVEVDNLAAILKAYTGVDIAVEGYTDNTGSQETNASLSAARADAVKAHLISQGIDESRISTSGFGSENPVASNDTPEGRAQNRRIEVRIVK